MTNKRQIKNDELSLAALSELFKNDRRLTRGGRTKSTCVANVAADIIAMYGEDGADLEFVVQRLMEEFPAHQGRIREIIERKRPGQLIDVSSPATLEEFEALAIDARPRNDDDWGTERQVEAENKFWSTCKANHYGVEDVQGNPTTEELIDIMMERIRKAKRPVSSPKATRTYRIELPTMTGCNHNYARLEVFFNGTLCSVTIAEKPSYFGKSADQYFQLWGAASMITAEGDGMAKTLKVDDCDELLIGSAFGFFRLRQATNSDASEFRYGVNNYRGLFLEEIDVDEFHDDVVTVETLEFPAGQYHVDTVSLAELKKLVESNDSYRVRVGSAWHEYAERLDVFTTIPCGRRESEFVDVYLADQSELLAVAAEELRGEIVRNGAQVALINSTFHQAAVKDGGFKIGVDDANKTVLIDMPDDLVGPTLEEKYDAALKIIQSRYAGEGEMRLAAFLRYVGEDDDWGNVRKRSMSGEFAVPAVNTVFEQLVHESTAVAKARRG